MTQENPARDTETVDSENIFDEFTDSSDIKSEISAVDKKSLRDMYYYIKKISVVILIINILLFMALFIGSLYIYIQEKEVKKEYSFLSPICSLFLWNSNITPGTCFGVTPLLSEYEDALSQEMQSQSQEISPTLWDVYSIENFNLSKKVSFLLEKSDTRLRPLEILEAFDELKNIFSPTDKWEVVCYDILITEDILDIKCDAFSSDWNTDILTLNDWSIQTLPWWGTSISKASSFMYFIENYRDSPFVVIEKSSSLSSFPVSWPYRKKTIFALKLQYAPREDLNF